MVAVGLPGVFTYGAKFLGYLVAVVVAAGVLVAAGVALAATAGLNLAAPSLGSLATGSAIAGAVLALLGVVVGLSGLFGLVHKLLADAVAVAVASSAASTASTSEDATSEDAADENDTDEETATGEDAESIDADQPAVAADAEETPLDGGDSTGTVADDPATDRPVDDGVAGNRPAAESNAPAAPGAQPGIDEPSTADDSGQQPADDAVSSPSRADVESHPHADDFVDESSPSGDWTDSKYATGTRQEGIPAEQAASADTAAGDDGVSTGEGSTGVEDQDRAEWTPPDPAEFEQSTDETPADGTAHTPEDETAVADVESQPEDEVRTWDDVQSASDGNGIETERETTDVGQTEPAASEPTDAVDLPDDDGSDGLFAQDEPNVAEPEPDETGDDDGATPAVDEDDEDDDLTLADEGVSSFEVDGDDDPLGDRLSGGD
ncbi:hypothetical protein SAMN05216559_2903 [Halomicrobium zhouii]|uniref:Uncharacterized protein n=1 Tax=Halomicrobium zhouii TaxID=767519 RepID=A0A1I6LQK0_9EURY|nr:hypothetical protein [Halomicrobium zhouii]SFS05688.1 hypothetical protein SAMN05216559_2903 [Halomicrobium zhouii]